MKHALAAFVVAALSASVLPAMAQNTASVDQQGSQGYASIYQESGLYPFQASIVQGSGVLNTAGIRQAGDDAQSFVRQNGDRNNAQVQQGTDGGLAKVWQGGADNLAVIDQLGHAIHADVQQSGSQNAAYVAQRDGFSSVGVTQQGTANLLTTNLNSFQAVSAEQRGDNNRANLGQDSYGDADIRLVQTGSWNDAATRGSGSFAIGQNGSSHRADIALDGIGARATVEQNGVANQASIISVGDGNLATVRQGGQANMAFVDQNRAGVTATITQNTVGAGYGNMASIVQR
jgi:hypothetical protein